MAKIEVKHPLYAKYSGQWARIRDVLEGSDQVKSKKETYLPRLVGQSDTDYAAYLLRATFFNIASRVFESNVGMITRRTPTVDMPKDMAKYSEDRMGFTSFDELSHTVIKEILAIGNVGVLIDIKADTPVPILFKSENILNWGLTEYGDLNFLILGETKYSDESEEEIYKYKMYFSPEGIYTVDTYKDGTYLKSVKPSYRGKTLDTIPFICGNYKGLSMAPAKSPVLDIVDLNLSHFRTSADYEHGLHFVALPTPVFTGTNIDTAITLGGSKGIVLPDDKAKAYYLEFQGQGLDSLNKALSTKQSQISLFSARLQDTNTKGSEAENTVRLRYSADSASLYTIAAAAELILNRAYSTIAKWSGVSDTVSILLNKDFLSTKLTPAELKELTSAYLEGAMDDATYIFNLERGEMTIPGQPIMLPKREDSTNVGKNGTSSKDGKEDQED